MKTNLPSIQPSEINMDDERVPFTVLGRAIGTASGWDQTTEQGIVLYDFQPAKGIPLEAGDLSFDSETGMFERYDDAGEVVWSQDAVQCLRDIPRN